MSESRQSHLYILENVVGSPFSALKKATVIIFVYKLEKYVL